MRGKRQSLDYGTEAHPTVSRLTAQFSLLGGGIAWLIHLLTAYVIGEFGCMAGWGDWIVGGLSMVAWLLLAVTGLTAAMAAAAAWASECTRRVLSGKGGDESVVAAENKLFIARVSLILNAVFAFIILVQGIPIFFYLRSC